MFFKESPLLYNKLYTNYIQSCSSIIPNSKDALVVATIESYRPEEEKKEEEENFQSPITQKPLDSFTSASFYILL